MLEKYFLYSNLFLFVLYSGDSTIVYNNNNEKKLNSDLAQTRLYWSFVLFFSICQF